MLERAGGRSVLTLCARAEADKNSTASRVNVFLIRQQYEMNKGLKRLTLGGINYLSYRHKHVLLIAMRTIKTKNFLEMDQEEI